MQNEQQAVHLQLTIDELNLILTALGQLPYVQVVGVLENIRKQAEEQFAAKTKANNNQK